MLLHKRNFSALQRTNEVPLDLREESALDAVPEFLLSVLSQDQLSSPNNRRDVRVRPSLRYRHKGD